MSFCGLKAVLLACSGIGAFLAATVDANAGGLAVHEQSAYGQGTSFAGIAAGGDLSGMFWNPAVMTQFAGIQSSVSTSVIFPYASNSPSAGSIYVGLPYAYGGTSNTGNAALVPSVYFSYQLNPNLWLGMSVNSPFGLSVSFPELWAGRDYAAGTSNLTTYNATPSVAYRINDWISVGAGVQIQYAKMAFDHGVTVPVPCPCPPSPGFAPVGDAYLSTNGWGYGFTAGITLTPTSATTIGLGYRSGIDQKFSGTLAVPTSLTTIGSFPASLTVNAPGILSLGVRQRIDPRWTLLGTVEWTNWNRIGTSVISGPPLTVVPAAALNLPFQYQDGWLFSVGAEYIASDRLTLRTGVGYEISPVTDQVRTPLIPDNDRFWASVGASWKIGMGITADLAYSHLFVRSTPINISASSGNPWFATTGGVTYIGSVESHVDILSIGVKYRWDEPAAPVKTGLITK